VDILEILGHSYIQRLELVLLGVKLPDIKGSIVAHSHELNASCFREHAVYHDLVCGVVSRKQAFDD